MTHPEPYISLQGDHAGAIRWFHTDYEAKSARGEWKPYADFERKKLKELIASSIIPFTREDGYIIQSYLNVDGTAAMKGDYEHTSVNHLHTSRELIGYKCDDYNADPESSRLLKRAEFLKAVCERENVEWLPEETDRGSYQPCRFCGERITTESEAIVGWHFKECPKPERDYYTKGDSDIRRDMNGLHTTVKAAREKGIDVVKVLVEPEEDDEREFRRNVFFMLEMLAKESKVIFGDFYELRRRFLS